MSRPRGGRLPRSGALRFVAPSARWVRVTLSAPRGAAVDVSLAGLHAATWELPAGDTFEQRLMPGAALSVRGAEEVTWRASSMSRCDDPFQGSGSRRESFRGLVLWSGRERVKGQSATTWTALGETLAGALRSMLGAHVDVATLGCAWQISARGRFPIDLDRQLLRHGFSWVGPPVRGAAPRPLLFNTTDATNHTLGTHFASRGRAPSRARGLPYEVVVIDRAFPDTSAAGMWTGSHIAAAPQLWFPGQSTTPEQYADWRGCAHKDVFGPDAGCPTGSGDSTFERGERRAYVLHATMVASVLVSALHRVTNEAGSAAGLAFPQTVGRIQAYALDLLGCERRNDFAHAWLEVLGDYLSGVSATRPIIVQTTREDRAMFPSADLAKAGRLRDSAYGRFRDDPALPLWQDAMGQRALYTDVADWLVYTLGPTMIMANGNGAQAGMAAGLNVVGVGSWRASEDHGVPEATAAWPLRVGVMARMNEGSYDNSVGVLWYATWRRESSGARYPDGRPVLASGYVARGIFKPEVVAPGSQVVLVRSVDDFDDDVWSYWVSTLTWADLGDGIFKRGEHPLETYFKDLEFPYYNDDQFVTSGTSFAAPVAGAASAWVRQLFGTQPTELERAILFASCFDYPLPDHLGDEVVPTPFTFRSTCVFGKVDFMGVWLTFELGRRLVTEWSDLDDSRLDTRELGWFETTEFNLGDVTVTSLNWLNRAWPMVRDAILWVPRKVIRIPLLQPGQPYRLVLVWNASPVVGSSERVDLLADALQPRDPTATRVMSAGVVDNPFVLAWLDLNGVETYTSYAYGTYRAFDFVAVAAADGTCTAEVHLVTPLADPRTPRTIAWALRPAITDLRTKSWKLGGYFCLEDVMEPDGGPAGNLWDDSLSNFGVARRLTRNNRGREWRPVSSGVPSMAGPTRTELP